MGKSFDEYAEIILSDSYNNKVASQNTPAGNVSILEQLASELNDDSVKVANEVTGPAAPANEGAVTPADSSVTGITPAVQSATEAVIYPQAGIAGCDPAEVAAGEVPQKVKPSEVEVISAGDGKSTTPNAMHKTPTAEAEGADASPKAAIGGEKTATINETTATINETPEQAGIKIAEAFYGRIEELQKQASLTESIEILETSEVTSGHIQGYDFSEFEGDNVKVAGQEINYLQKIANGEGLNGDDIIGAAEQVLEFEKEAEQADLEGRELAHAHYQEKLAEQEGGVEGQESFVEQADSVARSEKVASLLKDPRAVECVRYLKNAGAIELLQ